MDKASGRRAPVDHIGRQAMLIVGQLFKIVATMQEVDELLRWITSVIVQHLDVPVVQVWTNQTGAREQYLVQLRAMARRDTSVLRQVSVNEHVAAVAQRIAKDRVACEPPRRVEEIFARYETALLRRYGLRYFAACYTSSDMLPAPMHDALSHQTPPVPFEAVALLFFRSIPHRDLVPAIRGVLEQTLMAAERQGLLAATSQVYLPPVHENSLQEQIALLRRLVPCRKPDTAVMLSSSPFAKVAIKDKQARRLYAAINSRRNVADLCTATGMDMKDVYTALRVLLVQRYIELCGPDGRPVDVSLFLSGR